MKRSTTTLAIASGKGGVGKSVVAVNLACRLAAEGHRVALVDADFGQGACAVLFNAAPEATLLDVVRQTARTEAALHETPEGVTLVTAASEPGEADGREGALYRTLDALLQRLRKTHDYILIDAPAGVDGPVRWALDRADLGVLILVDEPTAVADAYRLAKLIWQADPDYPLGAVVNFADTAAEAQSVAERFTAVTEHFTGAVPIYLGWVPFSAHVRHSVKAQTPAVTQSGPVRDAFSALAETLAHGRAAASESILYQPERPLLAP